LFEKTMRTHVSSSSHASAEDAPDSFSRHIPVLLQPVIDALAIRTDGTYFDGTLGGGGHAEAVIARLSEKGVFIGIDKDERILVATESRILDVSPKARCAFTVGGFEDITEIAKSKAITQIDGALFDLGWGNHTLTNGRGFSFMKDEPLLMTYGTPTKDTLTALDVVNTWSLDSLTSIFKGWGEERKAYWAAKAIIESREDSPIKTTGQLIEILEDVIPKTGKVHPATRVFQALRIAVNNELSILTPAFTDTLALLVSKGRLVVITFHSGEDRIVKHLFNQWEAEGRGTHVTKKVIAPSAEEKLINPRARSAKLRIFEKI
jgi:16S rRNA (cytosine1402-N4)-methyltransferase